MAPARVDRTKAEKRSREPAWFTETRAGIDNAAG